jgi:hypothetical protein
MNNKFQREQAENGVSQDNKNAIQQALTQQHGMATVDMRIRTAVLRVTFGKKPWFLFWVNRKSHIPCRFQILVVTASGVLFEYSPFDLLIPTELAQAQLEFINNVISDTDYATRAVSHENENIRQLAYLKKTDFRDFPIRMELIQPEGKKGILAKMRRG